MQILKVLFIGLLCFAQPVLAADLRVGALLPLTGEFAFVGRELRRGIELALKEQSQHKIQVTFEDEGNFDRKLAVSAVNKMIKVDQVQIVFSAVVNTITAIAPILERNQIPGIVLWDSNQKISSIGSHIYGMGYSTELAGEVMSEFALQKLNSKKIAVISAHDEWSEIIAKAFIDHFQKYEGDITNHHKVDLAETNLRSLILKAKKNQVDALYLPLFARSLSSAIKQSRALGFKGELLTGDGFAATQIAAIGPAAEGVYSTQIWNSSKDFEEKYQRFYGESPSNIHIGCAELGYDGILLVNHILHSLKNQRIEPSSQTISTTLSQTDFKGVSGTISFKHQRHSHKKEQLVIVKNKTFKKI